MQAQTITISDQTAALVRAGHALDEAFSLVEAAINLMYEGEAQKEIREKTYDSFCEKYNVVKTSVVDILTESVTSNVESFDYTL